VKGDDRVTETLAQLGEGDETAPARLMPLVYEELRSIAAGYLARAHSTVSLQPTVLVHEAYLRLVDESGSSGRGGRTFAPWPAQAMHHILVDHMRSRLSAKRGGDWRKITLDEGQAVLPERTVDLLALDEALTALAGNDARQCQIVVFRFFGGMTTKEIAHVLGVSSRTVEEDWRMARAWLHRRLSGGAS
jgi:RNA polymerase sigma factor (TIGR02999 family)